jgi:hypothetical protein
MIVAPVGLSLQCALIALPAVVYNHWNQINAIDVMNSTCIHLRAKGPNIYMYRSERIYKEPPGEIQ